MADQSLSEELGGSSNLEESMASKLESVLERSGSDIPSEIEEESMAEGGESGSYSEDFEATQSKQISADFDLEESMEEASKAFEESIADASAALSESLSYGTQMQQQREKEEKERREMEERQRALIEQRRLQKARELEEAKKQEEAKQREKEEQEAKLKQEEERIQKEEQDKEEKEKERKRQLEEHQRTMKRQEEERKAREEEARKEREAEAAKKRKEQEEQERKATEEAERLKEERHKFIEEERQHREAQKKKEEQERRTREEAQRKQKEEADRIEREMEERRQKEDAERKQKAEEAAVKEQQEAEIKRKQQEDMKKNQEEEMEKKRKEDERREEESAQKNRKEEEIKRKAEEEAERKEKGEEEKKQQEEAERLKNSEDRIQEDNEKKQREEREAQKKKDDIPADQNGLAQEQDNKREAREWTQEDQENFMASSNRWNSDRWNQANQDSAQWAGGRSWWDEKPSWRWENREQDVWGSTRRGNVFDSDMQRPMGRTDGSMSVLGLSMFGDQISNSDRMNRSFLDQPRAAWPNTFMEDPANASWRRDDIPSRASGTFSRGRSQIAESPVFGPFHENFHTQQSMNVSQERHLGNNGILRGSWEATERLRRSFDVTVSEEAEGPWESQGRLDESGRRAWDSQKQASKDSMIESERLGIAKEESNLDGIGGATMGGLEDGVDSKRSRVWEATSGPGPGSWGTRHAREETIKPEGSHSFLGATPLERAISRQSAWGGDIPEEKRIAEKMANGDGRLTSERDRGELEQQQFSMGGAGGTSSYADGSNARPHASVPDHHHLVHEEAGSQLPQPEDFGVCVVHCMRKVICDMLQVKYSISLNTADFVKKVESRCDVYAALSVRRLAEEINSHKLRFLDARGQRVLQLHLNCRELRTFEELRRSIRLTPGTASAVVVTTAPDRPNLEAGAAFRMSYSDSTVAVGHGWRGAERPLIYFGEDGFCGAVTLDPVIVSLDSVNEGARHFSMVAPTISPEYAHLEVLLEEHPCTAKATPAAVAPRRTGALLAALHAPAPTVESMRLIGEALEEPAIEPEGVLEVLRKLADWLKPSDAAPARTALAKTGAHAAIICATKRCGSCHAGVAAWACRVFGWASRHHIENASAFAGHGAVNEVCTLLSRHKQDKEIQRHGLYAIGCLVHYGGGVDQTSTSSTALVVLQAMRTHSGSPSVQINGCEALRSLAEHGGISQDGLGDAACNAKRAFPQDVNVHRAADGLLSFIVPRAISAIGHLMDLQPQDVAVQVDAINALSQLTAYGGVAWQGLASVAVGRTTRAMQVHPFNEKIQTIGCWALGLLVERVDAPKAGIEEAVVRTKRAFPDSAIVRRYADALLALLMQRL